MEKRHFTRRNKIRVISYLTALILSLTAGTIIGYTDATRYKMQLEYTYRRALQDTAASVATLSTDLSKGLYAVSPTQISTLSAKIWREASTAKAALCALPISQLHLDNTYRFLSQVGDYAMSISKKAATGVHVSEEEWQNLASLVDYASQLNEHISSLEEGIFLGTIQMDDLDVDTEEGGSNFQAGFKEMEQNFLNYPSLIYDGPFSDHMLERNPRVTASLPSVTREAARETAAKALGVSAQTLKDADDENSLMPSYCFTNQNSTVGVTKHGGLVTYITASDSPTQTTVDTATALKAASAYLEMLGLTSMKSTYYEASSHILTINYAFQDGDVLCYTDLVKVGVSLETGKVIAYDARGFITNHQKRTFPTPKISSQDAQQKISSHLTILSQQLALIPSSGLEEVLTYELKTKNEKGEHVLVYINAQTGMEEQILMLIETENGVLTK